MLSCMQPAIATCSIAGNIDRHVRLSVYMEINQSGRKDLRQRNRRMNAGTVLVEQDFNN